MKFGLLWYDADRRLSPQARLAKGASRYEERFRRPANCCHVNPEQVFTDPAITVVADPAILKHHFWIGRDDALEPARPGRRRRTAQASPSVPAPAERATLAMAASPSEPSAGPEARQQSPSASENTATADVAQEVVPERLPPAAAQPITSPPALKFMELPPEIPDNPRPRTVASQPSVDAPASARSNSRSRRTPETTRPGSRSGDAPAQVTTPPAGQRARARGAQTVTGESAAPAAAEKKSSSRRPHDTPSPEPRAASLGSRKPAAKTSAAASRRSAAEKAAATRENEAPPAPVRADRRRTASSRKAASSPATPTSVTSSAASTIRPPAREPRNRNTQSQARKSRED
ncbi:MAG: hypothetical protein AB7P40_31235, partial [Chloroflexota bacterium]